MLTVQTMSRRNQRSTESSSAPLMSRETRFWPWLPSVWRWISLNKFFFLLHNWVVIAYEVILLGWFEVTSIIISFHNKKNWWIRVSAESINLYILIFFFCFPWVQSFNPFFWAMQSLFDLPTSLALIDNSWNKRTRWRLKLFDCCH